jgi:LmbE family N-acetylglucosaminyl deacetylase/PKD repeat protein
VPAPIYGTWNPQPAKATLMVIAAHEDDEGIFFGGLLPYFSHVPQQSMSVPVPMVHLCVIFARYADANNNETVRTAELLNSDWYYGLRNPPLFLDLWPTPYHGHTGDANNTFLQWDMQAGDPNPTPIAGRLVGAKVLATYIRTYRPEVVITQDYDGEYGHDDHLAVVRAVADAYTIAADANTNLSGLAPWQVKKLYMHEYGRTPSVPMLSNLEQEWDTPTPQLGFDPNTGTWYTPLQVADAGLMYQISQLSSIDSFLSGAMARDANQYGLYASTVGADTVDANGWAHNGFFEHLVLSTPDPNAEILTVSAGANQSIQLPANQVSLAGTVSDQNQPAGTIFTHTWSLTSGPAAVAFGDANALSTTATFRSAGIYILRLTASDAAATAFSECAITVNLPSGEQPYGGAPWPVPGRIEAENYDLGGQNVAYYDTTPGNAGGAYRTDDVDIRATTDVGGGYLIKQIAVGEWLKYTVNIAQAGKYNISVRAATGGISGYYLHIECDGNDVTGHINLAVTPDFDNCITNTVTNCSLPAGIHLLRMVFDTGQYNVNWFEIDAVPPPNVAPTVSAGANAKVMMPNALSLAGSISDDGLPNPPAACTAAWSKVSGPGAVTFANPAAATTATFAAAGTYILSLTASDSALVCAANVTITVLGAGDFNGDGKVDGVDFLIWQSHYPNFVGGATCDGGDANGDGKVDGVDFLVWQANYH